MRNEGFFSLPGQKMMAECKNEILKPLGLSEIVLPNILNNSINSLLFFSLSNTKLTDSF